ncbi:MAG TPA: FAD-dependent oxidoreductase [Candidatus Paceibacterota bacterium]|nr:FAD-dependent oxidoreductase [Candidatus Paceibacterota bacterium]
MYDLAIIGGGPAGVSAAVYAARKRLKTILITDDWGGQSTVSPEIQNWIGEPSITGTDLAKKLKSHVEQYKGEWLEIYSPHRATNIRDIADGLEITCSDSKTHQAKTTLVASGSNRRKLEVPGAKEFDQKGLTYCASCDGPLFADMDVAVIGGGNAAFETAMQLLAYCKSVTLLARSDFRADELTVEKVLKNPKLKALNNVEILAIEGDKFVNGLRYKDASGEEHLPVSGVFVEIGLVPNTEWLGDLVKKNQYNQVIADPYTQKTSHPRIWAAGDCTDGKYHQNNIASGDAVKALEDLYLFVHHEK